MSETRTCHECRATYPAGILHFKQVFAGKAVSWDTLCRDCRARIGARSWDVIHDNVSVEPVGFAVPAAEGFTDES